MEIVTRGYGLAPLPLAMEFCPLGAMKMIHIENDSHLKINVLEFVGCCLKAVKLLQH
jgi:hypothetical protein